MERQQVREIGTAVTRALNLLWDEIDGVYDDELKSEYQDVIGILSKAEKQIKAYLDGNA